MTCSTTILCNIEITSAPLRGMHDTESRMSEIPVDMCLGGYPDAACCSTARQSCDTRSVYVPASPRDARCLEIQTPSQPTHQRHRFLLAFNKQRLHLPFKS